MEGSAESSTRTISGSPVFEQSPQSLQKVRSSCVRCSKSIVVTVEASEDTEQNVCRICQSETGVMVKPCVCDGTMGTIHERCLNQWYEHSGKDHCEICMTKYARTKRVLKPIREWSRPTLEKKIIYKILALICASISLYQMILLFVQRHSYERFVISGISPRTHDVGRISIIFALLCSMVVIILTMVVGVVLYFRKQYAVRFTEHEKHKKSKKEMF